MKRLRGLVAAGLGVLMGLGVVAAQAEITLVTNTNPVGASSGGSGSTDTILLRGSSSAANAGGSAPTALTIDVPSGTAFNDVLIATVVVTPSSATVATPSGWTVLENAAQTSDTPGTRMHVYWRKAGASEPGSYAFAIDGGTATGMAGGLMTFYGVNALSPVPMEFSSITSVAGNVATAPGLATYAVNNSVLVTFHAYASSSTWSTPSGSNVGTLTTAYQVASHTVPSADGVSMIAAQVKIPTPQGTSTVTSSATSGAPANDEGLIGYSLRLVAAVPLNLQKPSGLAEGDLMIVSVGNMSTTATNPADMGVQTPAGWTLVRRQDSPSAGTTGYNTLSVFRKFASASEPATYTFPISGPWPTYGHAGIVAYRGVDGANPIDVEAGQGTASATTHATPAVTTTVANTRLVASYLYSSAVGWASTSPAGLTERYDMWQSSDTNQGMSLSQWDGVKEAAGSAGPYTGTIYATSYPDVGTTHLMALRPAPSEQMYFIQADHLNTPRLIENESQTAVWKWDQQEPFGANAANEDPDGNSIAFEFPLRLPGQYFDKETNNHYNMARDYDPATARYLQSDPIGLRGGLNSYVYAFDPLTQIDPRGLMGVAPGTFGKPVSPVGPPAPSFPGSACGPEGNPRNFPNDFWAGNFNQACVNHDACYDICGANKLWCDLKIGADIVRAARLPAGVAGVFVQYNVGAAYTAAVIFGGKKAYDAAQEKACKPGQCRPNDI